MLLLLIHSHVVPRTTTLAADLTHPSVVHWRVPAIVQPSSVCSGGISGPTLSVVPSLVEATPVSVSTLSSSAATPHPPSSVFLTPSSVSVLLFHLWSPQLSQLELHDVARHPLWTVSLVRILMFNWRTGYLH